MKVAYLRGFSYWDTWSMNCSCCCVYIYILCFELPPKLNSKEFQVFYRFVFIETCIPNDLWRYWLNFILLHEHTISRFFLCVQLVLWNFLIIVMPLQIIVGIVKFIWSKRAACLILCVVFWGYYFLIIAVNALQAYIGGGK